MKNFLQKQTGVQKLRFWGKIFGIQHDYYIIEADLDSFDGFDLNDPEFIEYQEAFDEEEENSTNEKKYQQRKVPPELIGDGINQKLFFVSNGGRMILFRRLTKIRLMFSNGTFYSTASIDT